MLLIIYILIISLNIALVLTFNSRYTAYTYNDMKALNFGLNYESKHLLETYTSRDQTFRIMKCIMLFSKSASKAISYEVNTDLTI